MAIAIVRVRACVRCWSLVNTCAVGENTREDIGKVCPQICESEAQAGGLGSSGGHCGDVGLRKATLPT